jgi:ABC-type bacteriocin/lantibiotic exporter with double-glycine peptidase domain
MDEESTDEEDGTLPEGWLGLANIRIRGLTVSYGESSPDVLHDLNLDIRVGPSCRNTLTLPQTL